MLFWHHLRLYACIALMLGVIVAGGWARYAGGFWSTPLGFHGKPGYGQYLDPFAVMRHFDDVPPRDDERP
jgi:hypothetical protein